MHPLAAMKCALDVFERLNADYERRGFTLTDITVARRSERTTEYHLVFSKPLPEESDANWRATGVMHVTVEIDRMTGVVDGSMYAERGEKLICYIL